MKINQKEVPIKFRRIAAQHLESIRGTKLGQNTEDLYLADEVCPIFRPDLKEPAYYEFSVQKATREKVDGRKDLVKNVRKLNLYSEDFPKAVYGTPGAALDSKRFKDLKFENHTQGFIIVSTGTHDFPISHWSLESASPSDLIEKEAKEQKKKVARIYKIDSLSYLGEDEKETQIALLGNTPLLPQGLPENLEKFEGQISSSVTEFDPNQRELDDSHRGKPGKTVNRGPKPKEYKFLPFKWNDFKKQFNESLSPMLKILSKNAKQVWDLQDLIEKMGEGVISGQVYNIAVLESEFTFEVSGKAADFVKIRVVKRPGNLPVLEVQSKKLPFDGEAELNIDISYGKVGRETVKLFIVNEDSPSETNSNITNEEL